MSDVSLKNRNLYNPSHQTLATLQSLEKKHVNNSAWNYLDLAQVFILVLRRDETVEFINQRGCELLGYTKDFVIGKNWFEFFIPPATQSTDKYHYTRALEKQSLPESYENCIRTRSGQIRTVSWRGSFLRDATGNVVALVAAGEDITEKLIYKKFQRRQQSQHNQQILSAIVDAQEKERSEIANELHGNVNQILTTCKLMLEFEKSRHPGSVVLGNVYEYLQNAIDEIRSLSHRLDSTQLRDLGLVISINALIEKIRIAKKYKLEFILEGEECMNTLDDRIALSVYRIVQEQLSNIIKHADASSIIISLTCSDISVDLEITDNGKGFQVNTSRKGLGLRNIYGRVALHKGTVSIHTAPGQGCVVSVCIPR